MTSIMTRLKTAMGIAALLSLLVGVQVAHATGTTAGTTVSNTATVNYSVGSVAQAPITSAPTSFVVDNKIDLTVTEVGGGATTVVPGQAAAVLIYLVSNTGNSPEGYQLSTTNQPNGLSLFGRTDSADFAGLTVFVDSNTNGTYDAGVDTVANIDTLAKDASVTVFVVVNVPNGATNAQVANVSLSARAAVPGTNGATLETETAGADTAAVDIVFADAGRDATQAADDQYFVQSAALNISKTSAVISDPFNGTTNPKSIPGAVVEYTVTIDNSGAVAATNVNVSDAIDANLSFVSDAFGPGRDVRIQVIGAGAPTFCLAESGADANTDGCNRTGATLNVNPTASLTVGPATTATVRFRATIN